MTRKHQLDATIVDTEPLGAHYRRVTLRAPAIAAEARPGHFVTLRLDRPGFPLLRRPIGIHRISGDQVQLLIKIVGSGTAQLAAALIGETINVVGPLGNGVFVVDPQRPYVLLVAGGIGIAPLLFLADSLVVDKALRPALLFGGATAEDLPAADDFRRLGLELALTTEDGSAGRRGLVTAELTDRLAALPAAATQVLACGPLSMLRAVARICLARGVQCEVSLEAVMACGLGSCYGCAVELAHGDAAAEVQYARVCHDGPVFFADRLQWDET